MDLLTLLFAVENRLFTVALLLMLFIALIEGVASLIGAGLSQFIDGLLPDTEFDIDTPESGVSQSSKLLAWLDFGKVPALIIFIVFLTTFGIVGLSLQSLVHSAAGYFLSGILASIGAFCASIPVAKSITSLLAKVLPRDETDAVPEQSFVGRVAKITLGTAKHGYPAQAKLKDRNGSTQYIMSNLTLKSRYLSKMILF